MDGRELEAELAEKNALLETMTPPDRPVADIETELADAGAVVVAKEAEVAQLEADLANAGGADPDIEAALQDVRDALAEAELAEQALAEELAEAEAYEALEAEIADLEAQLEDQPELERSLLEAAANKPVTDAVEEAVKRLLGL
jgi:chromosome segregation ATPase